MLVPLALLAFGALFAGLAFGGAFIGHGADHFWKESLYYSPENHIMHDMHDVSLGVGLAPTVMMVLGFVVALYAYILRPGTAQGWAERNPILYQFLLNKWYFDELYDRIFVRPAFWIGRLFWKQGDGRVIDGYGPDGIAARVLNVTSGVVRLQDGYVTHYAFAMLVGVAVIATYFLLGGGH